MVDRAPFAPVPVVGRSLDQSAATLTKEIDAWTSSEPLTALIGRFGGGLPDGTLASRLEYLDTFSEVWDFRGRASAAGQAAERNQAAIVSFHPGTASLIGDAVDALGLVTPNYPQLDYYDHVLINGALVRYSMWRMAYAGHVLRSGMRTGTVAALTAYRAMARSDANPDVDEPTLLARYGLPMVPDEAAMMEILLRREFGLGDMTEIVGDDTGARGARFSVRACEKDGMTFALVAAPDPTSAARAQTGDTMRFWATEVVALKPGDKVLSISSAIYGPFQHAAALQNLRLPYGAWIDTVAIDFDVIPPEPKPYTFSASQYLQEVRSTIRAYRGLLGAIEGHSTI